MSDRLYRFLRLLSTGGVSMLAQSKGESMNGAGEETALEHHVREHQVIVDLESELERVKSQVSRLLVAEREVKAARAVLGGMVEES